MRKKVKTLIIFQFIFICFIAFCMGVILVDTIINMKL